MEINKDNFAEAIKDTEFINDILPLVNGMDSIQTLITNKSDAIYKSKIDEEVKNTHTKYDDDIFAALGVRAGSNADGSKQKTYEFAKTLYVELADLRAKKDSLEKDQAVIDLKGQIEKLKNEGGGSHVQAIFDQAKLDWKDEKEGFQDQIVKISGESINYQKMTAISTAMKGIKLNPDIPESIQNIAIKDAENYLINNSKIEDGKLIFTDKDGKPVLDSEYKPIDAQGMLGKLDSIKDISLKGDNNKGGGGADRKINGSIETKNVEGKDTKKLILAEGSFKTKTEFIEVSEKAMIDSGITRRDPMWDKLKNEAYKEHKVAELPA